MVQSDSREPAVCNLRVDIFCPTLNLRLTCRAWGLGNDCLFVEDLPPLARHAPVDVEFPSSSGPSLNLTCTVGESAGDMAYLRFPAMSPEQKSRLEQLVWPGWDGQDLLEGVVTLSRHFPARKFLEWLSLTNLAIRYRGGGIGAGREPTDNATRPSKGGSRGGTE